MWMKSHKASSSLEAHEPVLRVGHGGRPPQLLQRHVLRGRVHRRVLPPSPVDRVGGNGRVGQHVPEPLLDGVAVAVVVVEGVPVAVVPVELPVPGNVGLAVGAMHMTSAILMRPVQ